MSRAGTKAKIKNRKNMYYFFTHVCVNVTIPFIGVENKTENTGVRGISGHPERDQPLPCSFKDRDKDKDNGNIV